MERIIIRIVVALSLVMSIIALCQSLPREAGVDYMGVIVGILSLLVTVLIGWNIYSIVDLNKREKKNKKIVSSFSNLKLKLEKDINKTKNELKIQWNIDLLEAVPIMLASQLKKDLAQSLALCFNTYGRVRTTESIIAAEMAKNYVRGIADILYSDGREHQKTVQHIVEDIKDTVSLDNVQFMWNDTFLRKDADDVRLLALLLDIIQGLSQQSPQDIPTKS